MKKNITTEEMNRTIAELKSYMELAEETKKQIEALKAEAIEYLDANELDEFINDKGTKITYREVKSTRLDTKSLKEQFSDIYNMFSKATSNFRFTLSN